MAIADCDFKGIENERVVFKLTLYVFEKYSYTQYRYLQNKQSNQQPVTEMKFMK